MKKKGFTLVELLAVIAILAILVIIALPNIMALFNDAKQNSFTNEIKELYKTAQNQWMSDSMMATADKCYSRTGSDTPLQGCGSVNDGALKLSGRTQLHYGIKVNKAGNVVSFAATDGTYAYFYNGTGLKIEEIGSATASNNTASTANAVLQLSAISKTAAAISVNNNQYVIAWTPAS